MGYLAATAIKYSDPKDPGGEVVEFAEGDKVEGLPVDTMKMLWENGALVKEEDKPVTEPTNPEAPVEPTPDAPVPDAPADPDAPSE